MTVSRLLAGTGALGVSNYTVCTSGTRPGSPTEGMLIYETDTDLIYFYTGASWQLAQIGVVTAATRPATPREGTFIYETDTDLFYYYTGASWQLRGHGITTAATHPATPIEGSIVFDTDTDMLMVYDGAAWVEIAGHGAWKTYTPTWTGVVGNGTMTAAWRRQGRTIHFRIEIVWGSTTTHAAAIQSLTLPVAPHAAYVNFHPINGNARVLDSGVNSWAYHIEVQGTTIVFTGGISTTAPAVAGQVSNTVPFTFATADALFVAGSYEAAA